MRRRRQGDLPTSKDENIIGVDLGPVQLGYLVAEVGAATVWCVLQCVVVVLLHELVVTSRKGELHQLALRKWLRV